MDEGSRDDDASTKLLQDDKNNVVVADEVELSGEDGSEHSNGAGNEDNEEKADSKTNVVVTVRGVTDWTGASTDAVRDTSVLVAVLPIVLWLVCCAICGGFTMRFSVAVRLVACATGQNLYVFASLVHTIPGGVSKIRTVCDSESHFRRVRVTVCVLCLELFCGRWPRYLVLLAISHAPTVQVLAKQSLSDTLEWATYRTVLCGWHSDTAVNVVVADIVETVADRLATGVVTGAVLV